MTGWLLLAARLLLAVGFAVAGTAKLADPRGARLAAVDLGVPQRLAGAAATAVPVAEIAVAALLLPSSTAVIGAAAALCLLLAFSSALAWALVRGRTPDCHCFGQLRAAPAGWATLVRNAILAGLAAFVLVAGRDDPGPDAVVALAALGLLVLGLGAFLLRGRRPAAKARAVPHAEAPPFSAPGASGELVSLDDLLETGRPVLLVFPGPAPSDELTERLAELQRYESYALTVAIVLASGEGPAASLEHALLDPDGTVLRAYGVSGTPSAVLVSSYGMLASAVEAGEAAIGRLAELALEEEEAVPQWVDGLPSGAALPELALPDLRGHSVELRALVRDDTVFLFWRPGCRPCRGLYEQVRAWERYRPEGAPELVVVSVGGMNETASERFRSRVLLDVELAASDAFRAEGAPMAVRVDTEGRIASRVAVGPEAVLELLEA